MAETGESCGSDRGGRVSPCPYCWVTSERQRHVGLPLGQGGREGGVLLHGQACEADVDSSRPALLSVDGPT